MLEWPDEPDELVRVQHELRASPQRPWAPPSDLSVAGCFVCFGGVTGRGASGDPAWAAAASVRPDGSTAVHVHPTRAAAPYSPGLLALREGPPLSRAVRALGDPGDILLVNAAGRDHPRRAGLALHLGAVLDIPTVGVTHRPLCARGEWPEDRRGAAAPLVIGDEVIGAWLRTRGGARPLAVSAGWRTEPDAAVETVRRATGRWRTPVPLRVARHAARQARTGSGPLAAVIARRPR